MTVLEPREPITLALAMRGDLPVSSTSTFRRLPSNSPASADSIASSESVSFHVCTGEASSNGSSTDFRYGIETPPAKPNSEFSVWPPEVEK